MALFPKNRDAEVQELQSALACSRTQLKDKATYAATLEARLADTERQVIALRTQAAAIEKIAGLSANLDQASSAVLTLAAAVAEGNKQIASAIGALALATERKARAAQAQVEFNKAQANV